MITARSIAALLPSAPTRRLHTTLVRRVPLSPLIKTGTVDYLFTSGRASRFNTAGVKCVYFAEDEATATAEYERRTLPLHQPFATFFAEVELAAVLDLCSAATLKALGLTVPDLQANWVRARRPIATQVLGEAVSQQVQLTAIRFPSDAARMKGFAGANGVIFYDTMLSPDYVHILGPTKRSLQKWP